MQPHRIKCGASVILLSVEGLAADWGISPTQMSGLLDLLEIPRLRIPPDAQEGVSGDAQTKYVSLFALEHSLWNLGLPRALYGQTDVLRESAGLLYGAMTREAIQQRVRTLAKTLKGSSHIGTWPAKKKKPKKKT